MNDLNSSDVSQKPRAGLIQSFLYCLSIVGTCALVLSEPLADVLGRSHYGVSMDGAGGYYTWSQYPYVAIGFLIAYYGATWLSFKGMETTAKSEEGVSKAFGVVATSCGFGFILGLLVLGAVSMILKSQGIWPGWWRWGLEEVEKARESGSCALQAQAVLWGGTALFALAVYGLHVSGNSRHLRHWVWGIHWFSILLVCVALVLAFWAELGDINGLFFGWCGYWWAFRARSLVYGET